MLLNTEKNITSLFHFLCITAALLMIIYCGVEFIRNEDVTEISYKSFNGNYPDLTLCFYPPFIDENLMKYGKDLKTWQYGLFLSGYYWDDRMPNIDYTDVTINWEDILLQTCVRSSYTGDGVNCINITNLVSFSFMNYKCFSFHPEDDIKTIMSMEIRIKSSAFPNGIRPQSGGLLVHLHYPKQFLRSWSTGL